MFRRLVATSRAPQIMVLSMLRSFGKIGPQIDQIWAWLSRGHRWSPGVWNPLKSSVTGPSLLVNCYLEIKFHKIIRVNPPLKPSILKEQYHSLCRVKIRYIFTNDVIQKSPFLPPSPLSHRPSSRINPPPPLTSSWPDPPSNFHFFKIDINVESRPSYDTIFQYLLKLNVLE